jgi:YbgC/YbaW family acyl-CoA thioester hydrolase
MNNLFTTHNAFKVIVKNEHIDFMGHVNNAVYEEARWYYYKQFGYTKEYVYKLNKGPIILNTRIQYKKELTLHEEIYVRSKCLSYKGKVGTMQQIIFKTNGEIACIAEFMFGFFDLISRKLISPSGPWLEMHKIFGVLNEKAYEI